MVAYHSRKYVLNENFLDTWGPEMAYVLGFWFADGYMRVDKSYRVSFAAKDKVLLVDIQKALGSTNPVKLDSRSDCWVLTVHSKHLYERLEELGGHTRKSKTIALPDVPQEYQRDFVRGYFDGDGSVFLATYRSSKNKRMRTELRSNFTSGCAPFLEQLRLFLHQELGLAMNILGAYNEGASLKLGYATRDTQTLLRYMYYPGYTIGLLRKADYAKTFCFPSFLENIPISRFTLIGRYS